MPLDGANPAAASGVVSFAGTLFLLPQASLAPLGHGSGF